jgi:hypothetical protein
MHSPLRYPTPEEFEQASGATGSDGTDGSGGKPTAGLPPPPQALEIPSGFPTPAVQRPLIDKMNEQSMAGVSPINRLQRVSA